MGSTGRANTITTSPAVARRLADEREYKSNTNDIDYEGTMLNAYFQGVGDLLRTINRAENERFDILSRVGGSDSGTILYMDGNSSDGGAYEIYYQKTYANPNNPSEIQIRRFRRYEEGEW